MIIEEAKNREYDMSLKQSPFPFCADVALGNSGSGILLLQEEVGM
nr:hypothetical protein Iba_chr03aCG17060 [Ipomoea batatas]GMC77108.1 hypothetical protein Iba_chr03eCG7540 [Ipomoea batatas]GME14467.1 hypothetical protein Iba_scaffold15225CG0460 [Ipomoea batatas]